MKSVSSILALYGGFETEQELLDFFSSHNVKDLTPLAWYEELTRRRALMALAMDGQAVDRWEILGHRPEDCSRLHRASPPPTPMSTPSGLQRVLTAPPPPDTGPTPAQAALADELARIGDEAKDQAKYDRAVQAKHEKQVKKELAAWLVTQGAPQPEDPPTGLPESPSAAIPASQTPKRAKGCVRTPEPHDASTPRQTQKKTPATKPAPEDYPF